MTHKIISAILFTTDDKVTLPFKGVLKTFENTPIFSTTVLNSLIYVHKNMLTMPEKGLNQIIELILEKFIQNLSDMNQRTHDQVAQGFMHVLEHMIKPEWGLDVEIPQVQDIVTKLKDLIRTGEEIEKSMLHIPSNGFKGLLFIYKFY